MDRYRNVVIGRSLGCLCGSLLFAGIAQAGSVGSSSDIVFKDGDTIAFLGDSITAAGASYGNYCRLVVQGLKARDVHVHPVMAGVPGNTSKDMLARLDRDVLAYKPDWVVLAAGVNDVWHTDPTAKIGVFQPKPGMGVELEDYKRNIHAMIERCESAGANVVLTTITPIREDPETNLNIKARAYNAFLLALARERGIPIAHLNEAMFAEIAKGRRLTSDGVHPMTEGHRIMAKGILQALGFTAAETEVLEKEWQNAPTVLILGDRQTTAGTREGGWCHLLMDGMNHGREMVTFSIQAIYREESTAGGMLAGFRKREAGKDRFVILQAPRGDAVRGTPLADYRQELATLVAAVRERGSVPLLVTIPVQGDDPESAQSKMCESYNDILRMVAIETDSPLADINKAMASHYAGGPEDRLIFDGERFNRAGSMLMAETILRAMGLESRLDPALRNVWAERSFYAD